MQIQKANKIGFNWKIICTGMILLQSLFYGLMDPLAKIVYMEVPVLSFMMLRNAIAASFIFLLWRKKIIKELKNVSVKHYIVPCLCMACAFNFSHMALEQTAATNVAFLRSLSTLMVPLMLLIFYHKRYSKKTVLLQLMMLLGLYLLCAHGGLTDFGKGEIYAIIAALLVAGSLVFGRDSLKYIGAETLSFVQSACAVVICFVWGMANHDIQKTQWMDIINPTYFWILIYAALMCTVGGYLLQNIALRHISCHNVGVLQATYPVITALAAAILLHEHLSTMGLVGAAIIVSCVVFGGETKGTSKVKLKLKQVQPIQ
ncbi:MAG: DMT family transporter [Suipraeoptans sp.]